VEHAQLEQREGVEPAVVGVSGVASGYLIQLIRTTKRPQVSEALGKGEGGTGVALSAGRSDRAALASQGTGALQEGPLKVGVKRFL
jgi:hypothetical protein